MSKRKKPKRIPPVPQPDAHDDPNFPPKPQGAPQPPQGATPGEHAGGELIYHPVVPGDLCILISQNQHVLITMVTEITELGVFVSSSLTLNPQYPKGNGFITQAAMANVNSVRFVFKSELIQGFNVLVGKQFSSIEEFNFQIMLFQKGDPLQTGFMSN